MTIELSRALSDKSSRIDEDNLLDMLNREIVPYLRELGRAVQAITTSGGDVVGPASATDNAAVRFDGATGKLVQNSAVTIADTSGNITAGTINGVTMSTVVIGPGSATDNALARYDGTTGKLVQDSGVTLSDSNDVAGVDDLTVNGALTMAAGNIVMSGGATVDGVDISALLSGVADQETVFLDGSDLNGRDERWVVKTGAQTNSTGSAVNVTDLVFNSLKASTTYCYRFILNYQSDATTTGMLLNVDYSSTVTSTFYGCHGGTGFQAYVNNTVVTDNTATGSTTFGPGTTNRMVFIEGIIVTNGSGNLQLTFVRGSAAGSVTIQLNSFGHLVEMAT